MPAILKGVLACTTIACLAAAADTGSERALRRSDVVFFIDAPDQYEAYGCTVVGWGGTAKADRIASAHAKGVRLLATDVAFRTAFHRVIDYSPNYLDAACRNFAGEPFAVPWLWDHKYKDQPVWWGCTNSPLYREWLEHCLADAMAAGPDGLHIDDYTGTAGSVTWLWGCFCPYCMSEFRDYLKAHVAPERLAEFGIQNIDAFDYRQFLVDRGVTPEEYRNRRGAMPLAGEFYDFQAKSDTDYVRRFHELACRLRGQRVTLSVNSGLDSPLSIMIAPYVDYFCCEVGQDAASGGWPKHSVYIYKLADGLNRPVAAMGSGQDHAFVAEHKTEELLRTWIVTAYSHGQAFTAPTRLWCYTKEKGTHWYEGPQAEYAWLFRFVRDHAPLLDGCDAVAPVAVVYDNAARRRGRADIAPVCSALEAANVPFAVVVAGDDWLDYRLTGERIAPYRTLIVAETPGLMDAEQRALLTDSGRMAVFDPALVGTLPRIAVEGDRPVAAVLRAKPGDPQAPVVCHVHARGYDAKTDRVVAEQNVVLHIPRTILPERDFPEAVVATPGKEDLRVATELKDGEVLLRLPEVGLWAVVSM